MQVQLRAFDTGSRQQAAFRSVDSPETLVRCALRKVGLIPLETKVLQIICKISINARFDAWRGYF